MIKTQEIAVSIFNQKDFYLEKKGDGVHQNVGCFVNYRIETLYYFGLLDNNNLRG